MKNNIETRKIVPIAAKISAGKSFLLNVIYNIDFLECKAGIGTKFVNIIRYNPDLEKPCFYHLKAVKKKGNYIFKKDQNYEVKYGKEAIIEENKNVNQILAASPGFDYQDIFYMTELNECEFIKDKEYLLTHDLCDIPGLSEYQSDANKEIVKKDNDQKDFEQKIEEGMKKYGIVFKEKQLNKNFESHKKNNDKKEGKDNEEIHDDLYNEIDITKEQSYLTEIFKIIKNYIDGIIIVLSIENYQLKENFEIITKLRKVINKEINNSLVILNKIDLSQNPKQDINNCKGLFFQKFPKCQVLNLNFNTFIALSAKQLKNELLMKDSFEHLIKYHFFNYSLITKQQSIIGSSFMDYLLDFILNGENSPTIKEIKTEVDKLNKSKNISEINQQILKIVNELKEQTQADENIILGIEQKDIIEEEEEDDEKEEEDENNDQLSPSYIIKMIYVLFEQKKSLPLISEETNQLLDYFSVKKVKKNFKLKPIKMGKLVKLNKKLIDVFESFGNKINAVQTTNDKLNNLTEELAKTIHFLKIYNVIILPFLGPSNAGKSTIINGIIGKDILPVYQNECTKRGIIIGYSKSEEPLIYKASFVEQKDILGKTNYYFNLETNNIIGEGEQQVKETLNSLNLEFNEKKEDSFYYVTTKIKLLDDLNLNESLKEMIYLIDFPGFGTNNKFEENDIYIKTLSICNSFIFVVRNSVIKENSCQRQLNSLFEYAQQNCFISKFVKSSLFILNNDLDQSTTENDLNQVCDDIIQMIYNKNMNLDDIKNLRKDIKLCFFNAKYYYNFCSNYNYFYDLDNLLHKEYKNYKVSKYHYYQNPKSNKQTKDKGFFEYFIKNLKNKVKNTFHEKITNKFLKSIEIDKKFIEESIIYFNKIINEENLDDKTKFNEKQDEILKLIFYGQNKALDLKTLKESNIDKFKEILESQINYINEIKQNELIEKIENTVNTLDLFFRKDFNERKKDIGEINDLSEKLNKIEKKISLLLESIQIDINNIIYQYRDKISNSLKEKKNYLIERLEDEQFQNIIEEINKEMKNNLNGLNMQISKYLEKYENECLNLHSYAKEIINSLSIKYNPLISNSFKRYIIKQLGNENEDLEKQIFEELKNSCESSSNILFKIGFKEWLSSLFSYKSKCESIIQMLIDTSLKKMDSTFKLIKEKSQDYLTDFLNYMKFIISYATIKFTEEQRNKWAELCNIYEVKKKEIIEIKDEIVKSLNEKNEEENN